MENSEKPKVVKTRALPVKELELGAIATLVSAKWMANPWMLLLWLTSAQFATIVASFNATLNARNLSGGTKTGVVKSMKLINKEIDDAMVYVKNYILEIFKKEQNHYGIVIDEYGNTVGMVTMHDVLDALVGDTATKENFDYRIIQRNENSWLADAQFPIVEFIKYFNLEYEFENKDNYTTLVGFFLNEHNGSTEVGDQVKIEDLELEIIDKDRQRVDKILITRNSS